MFRIDKSPRIYKMASANIENSFLSQIESVRTELKQKVSKAHQVLQGREAALLSELQQLEVSYRAEGIEQQLKELRTTKEDNIATLTSNANKDILMESVALLDIRLRELEANLKTARDRLGQVELEWDENLEGVLNRTGFLRLRGTTEIKRICEPTRGLRIIAELWSATSSDSVSKKELQFTGVTEGNDSQQDEDLTLDEQSETAPPRYSAPLPLNSPAPPSTKNCEENYTSPNTQKTTFGSKIKILFSNSLLLLTQDKLQQAVNFTSIPTYGLYNLGNTCYMNSILQCLSHTLPLREFYVSDEYKQFLNKRGDLSSDFKRVMVELWDSTSQLPVDPYVLRREVKARTDRFPDYTQHDAHGFMRFLLNELHEEINRASVEGRKSPADNETLGEACARHLTWEDSRISELFGGMLRSEVCCSVCSDKSIVYIPFMDIALAIPKRHDRTAVSLSDCLAFLRRKETLNEEVRPYCNKCMDLTKSTKQLFVSSFPRYLVIQLKRFSYYPTRTKLTTPVKFTETWRLKDSSDKTHTYSLYGISCHLGDLHGGHYVAYCCYKGIWRCFNDSMVSTVSWDHVKRQEAYILFYTDYLDIHSGSN